MRLSPIWFLAGLVPPLASIGTPLAQAVDSITLPQMSVTASPVAGDQPGSFLPVTTLDQARIAADPARSLGDLMRDEPGLTSTSFAPGASRPVIRGLDNFRVRLQENGFGAGDVSAYGEDHAVPLDPMSAERIEVIRGPASLRWGSQAIGGVVNVINNRIPTSLPDQAVKGRVSGGWNSGSRGWDGVASADVRAGNVVVHGDVFGRHDGDYAIPGGRRQANSGVRTDGGSMGLSYFFDQGFIGASVSRFTSLYGIPGGEEAALGTQIRMEQTRWASRGEYRPGSGPVRSVNFWLGYTTYRHEEIGAEHDHAHHHHHDHDHDHDHDHAEPAARGRHVHGSFRNRSWDGRLELQHMPAAIRLGELNGTLGFSIEREALRTTGEFLEYLPPATTERYAGYVFEELSLTPALRLQAAARIEFVRLDGSTAGFPQGNLPLSGDQELENAARRRGFTPVSFSLGALHDLPWGLQARATAQYVQRAPSAAELFARGAHHASGTFDIGNPNLRKEAATTLELGLARQAGGFRFDASAYYSRFNGFITRALTGNSCGESFSSCAPGGDGEFRQVAYGQRDASFYGFQGRAEQDVLQLGGGTAGVSARYDFVRAEFANGAGNVPRIPPHRLGAGVWWRSPTWNAALDYLHAFDQTRTGANETRTEGYDLLNLRVGYTRQLGGTRAVNLSVIGSNLLDSDMRNAASFKKDEVLLPGRAVRLLATFTF
ncbi:TonB-dependent receptor [Roseococcus sp. SYP-B2431]|uniref:TonB-dependent receptor n=1 Tax=Roseococcus sp. SYP-B2431 TaxID=2496640 RepID=UPI001040767F|nr:TonB-dependent receptor [Roseococcus sp. SYP-B2431]TCH97448.1 TonB-dependent receptor [Roseococcus sp. SYP-B2431]